MVIKFNVFICCAVGCTWLLIWRSGCGSRPSIKVIMIVSIPIHLPCSITSFNRFCSQITFCGYAPAARSPLLQMLDHPYIPFFFSTAQILLTTNSLAHLLIPLSNWEWKRMAFNWIISLACLGELDPGVSVSGELLLGVFLFAMWGQASPVFLVYCHPNIEENKDQRLVLQLPK